jgi:hypothetical protein
MRHAACGIDDDAGVAQSNKEQDSKCWRRGKAPCLAVAKKIVLLASMVDIVKRLTGGDCGEDLLPTSGINTFGRMKR